MAVKSPNWRSIFCLLLSILHHVALVRAQCEIPPLQLSWSNTTLSEDGLAVTRGIEVGIGTPNQIFAFRPSTTLNNTRINNVLGCITPTNDSCVGSNGGVFQPSKSSTYSVSIRAQWNGSQIDQETSTGAYVYFHDAVDFQRNGHVDGFPLVMNSEPGGGPQSGLPLGTNSSFLGATVKGRVAPSTAFGLWTGSRSLAPVDGLLVIGGYDESRVNGPFTNFSVGAWSLRRACPLQVNVTGLSYDGVSLFNNDSESMIACVEPSTQRFVFTPSVATTFARVTGQNSSAYTGMTYPASDAPRGNLTITLDNGYTTTITNNELFAYLRGSDQYGRYSITNNTVVEAGIADSRRNDPGAVNPTLGGLFLTFNYLVVDYDQGIFRMAPAVASDVQVGSPKIRTICTPTATPSPSDPSSSSSSSTNVGAIAGGTVGGVAGLAMIGLLVFFLLRRRRRRRTLREESKRAHDNSQSPIVELPVQAESDRVFEMPAKRFSKVPEEPYQSGGHDTVSEHIPSPL